MNDKKNNELIKEDQDAKKDSRIPENEYAELSDDDLEQVSGGGKMTPSEAHPHRK